MTSIAMVLTAVERGNDRLFPALIPSLPPSLPQFRLRACLSNRALTATSTPALFPLLSHWPHVSDMVRKLLDGLLSGMERKLDSWLGSLSL